MANTHELYEASVAGFRPALESAIRQSESQNEIVHVTLKCRSIGEVETLAAEYADHTDCVRENDGSWDLWGWSQEMEDAGSSDMLWRLKVSLDRSLSDKANALVTQLLTELGEEITEDSIAIFTLNHEPYLEAAANGDVDTLAMLRRNCGLNVL